MKKTLLTIISLIAVIVANAQITFVPSLKQTAPDEITISFAGTIDDGWHVYAPNEANGPTPATFNAEKLEGLEKVGGLVANKAPIKKFESMFEAEVSFFEHSVTFSQKLRITGKTYNVEGYLEYGACDDNSCMPPTAVDFKFSGKGVETPVAAKEEQKVEEQVVDEPVAAVDSVVADTIAGASSSAASENGLWTPVIDQLNSFGSAEEDADFSLWRIFILKKL